MKVGLLGQLCVSLRLVGHWPRGCAKNTFWIAIAVTKKSACGIIARTKTASCDIRFWEMIRWGTGKTTTLKYVLAERRLAGDIVLVAAPTNLAALLYDGGVSVHALCDLCVVRTSDDYVTSYMQGKEAKALLIAAARIIVIDELPSLTRGNFEAMLGVFDAVGFKGVLVMSGDFRQIGGVVPNANDSQQINNSPCSRSHADNGAH